MYMKIKIYYYIYFSDAGIYECQVSTTPPIGHYINLTVVEPETEIIGGFELFVDTGSTVNLTCITRLVGFFFLSPEGGFLLFIFNVAELNRLKKLSWIKRYLFC